MTNTVTLQSGVVVLAGKNGAKKYTSIGQALTSARNVNGAIHKIGRIYYVATRAANEAS